MVSDKRKTPRQRSFLRGFVRLGDQNYSMACVVRDVSKTGAKLRFKLPVSFTGKCELHIPDRQETFHANVVWVKNRDVGVSFNGNASFGDVAPPNVDATDAELVSRMAQLEDEIIQLKRLLESPQKRSKRRA